MSENSKIEWCDHTFNPWIGCTKVSPGCANCYAETLMDKRYGRVRWGKGNPRSRTSEANWKKVETWNKNAHRPRPRVFVASLADWLDPEVPIEWLADMLDLIRGCQHLDFLLLTKRPKLWEARLDDALMEAIKRANQRWAWEGNPTKEQAAPANWISDWLDGYPPANVWIGTSVEDQQRADERIPELLKIPARVRFLSCEPLLGQVDLRRVAFPTGRTEDVLCDTVRTVTGMQMPLSSIHWVICGGESGPGARPMHPDWARSLRDQCQDAGVPFLFKQWGEHDYRTIRMGKKASGRLLDGREWNEFPKGGKR